MAASVNGWRVLTRGECTDVKVPGGMLPVHPDFAWLAWDCAHLWHETVEELVWPGCWGWAEPRPIRGDTAGTTTSNHCSATAWDLCAPKHPRGVPIWRTFTAEQLQAIAAMEARYAGVLRWGGRWSGADVDGMHWEGVPGVTVEAVHALTARLRDDETPPAPAAPPKPAPVQAAKPKPKPAPAPKGWTGPDLTGRALALRGDAGNNGPRVKDLQAWLLRTFPAYAREGLGTAGADGWWGSRTTTVLRQYAQRSGIKSADGANIGPQIARKLYLSGFRG